MEWWGGKLGPPFEKNRKHSDNRLLPSIKFPIFISFKFIPHAFMLSFFFLFLFVECVLCTSWTKTGYLYLNNSMTNSSSQFWKIPATKFRFRVSRKISIYIQVATFYNAHILMHRSNTITLLFQLSFWIRIFSFPLLLADTQSDKSDGCFVTILLYSTVILISFFLSPIRT